MNQNASVAIPEIGACQRNEVALQAPLTPKAIPARDNNVPVRNILSSIGGDIPSETQPKLLRILQEREFERLGSTYTRTVNVRIVAATNRNLEKMIANREFRSDLYYRLNVFPIRIPALRERKEDIPRLVNYYLRKFSKQMGKNIEYVPPAAMRSLKEWDWPGNVRELENFIERSLILTHGRVLEVPLNDLRIVPADHHDCSDAVWEGGNSQSNTITVAEDYAKEQREAIVRALTESRGRVGGANGAAARMSVNRPTLLSRMKRFGIDRSLADSELFRCQ